MRATYIPPTPATTFELCTSSATPCYVHQLQATHITRCAETRHAKTSQDNLRLASSSAVDHAISIDAYLAFLTIVFSDSTG